MRLRINLLFLVEATPRGDVFAECTVQDVCLRTSVSGTPIPSSGNVFEWQNRTGFLEFSGIEQYHGPFRIGFFEQTRGDEETPIGFCELSGHAGFQTAVLQRSGSTAVEIGSAVAGFEVRWVGGETGANHPEPLSPVNDYSIVVTLAPSATSTSSSSSELPGERFWFSYNYCRCEIRTDAFLSPTAPRFGQLADTFRLRANNKDVLEMLDTYPVLVRLHSSTRGVIGLAALAFKHQSSRTVAFIWQRHAEDTLGEISARMELFNSSAPFLHSTETTIIQASASKDKDDIPPPPPPPLPLTAPVVSSQPTSLREEELERREQRVLEHAKKMQTLEEELSKLEVTLSKRDRDLTKREETLSRKFERDTLAMESQVKRVQMEAKQVIGEAQLRVNLLESEVKTLEETNYKLKRKNQTLQDELTLLMEKRSKSELGEMERRIAQLTGKNELLQDELEHERMRRMDVEARLAVALENRSSYKTPPGRSSLPNANDPTRPTHVGPIVTTRSNIGLREPARSTGNDVWRPAGKYPKPTLARKKDREEAIFTDPSKQQENVPSALRRGNISSAKATGVTSSKAHQEPSWAQPPNRPDDFFEPKPEAAMLLNARKAFSRPDQLGIRHLFDEYLAKLDAPSTADRRNSL